MYEKTLLLSIILSLLFCEFMGINPGGIIVPGYLVLNLNNYPKIIYTILISLLTMLVIKFFSRYVIIYGRRKFALMILTAYFLNLLIVYSGIYNPKPRDNRLFGTGNSCKSIRQTRHYKYFIGNDLCSDSHYDDFAYFYMQVF
ncbi:poly-gamma-glutamate biosynthesis protein PgsC/CapC [Treponema phagedenis]|uniref:poly-gamma-glutamate biosynthesis protein PgsC/CapC n=1 Tax=Treponema phagedenis TaxID=162 RepID=UPI0015A67D75|nr:hypothetical protein [Treponema phagedenis]